MAIDYFSKTYPLITPEWQAWSASVPTPRLEGRWLITGRQAGRGPLFGEMTIEPAQAPDEFTSKIDVRNLRDGSRWTRAGRGLVYAGHSWRGRSTGTGGNGPESVREAMLVSRDWKTMEGRWFWGSYDEFGLEVVLRRVGPEPVVAAIDPPVLKLPLPSERVTIHGTNLPADIKVNEIDFGSGIKVVRIVSARSDAVTVEVSVARDAASGRRDVSLRQIIATGAVVVFDKVDYIKALPGTGLARLGGIKYPKQHQQFEAVAYNRGPDGTPHTADDVNLGLVDAEWSIEEFPGSYFDDDREFVGTIDKQGLFTPAVEGPNPNRSGSRNNYGDVSIVASYKPDPASTTALKARCYLIVTLPLYVRWDTPEISR
jgi:quinohemoprotein amine dehydrogenase